VTKPGGGARAVILTRLMETTLEYERKLEAPPGFELPDLGGEPLETRVFTSIYHDTADHSLARSGITLRRRTERGKSVWQLKLPVDGALAVELKWLGSVLGGVRDLDVLLERLRAASAELDPADRAAAGRLLRSLDRQRSRVRRTLLKALDGNRYAVLLDRFEAMLAELEPGTRKLTLDARAARQLKKLERAVDLIDAEPADTVLHDLRKRGKRVRYAHELSGGKTVVRRAKELQDVLGEHQDSVVAEERLRALSHDAPPDQALAAGLLVERERARRAEARASWRAAWRRLERAAR
jgi:CHAD domain-containing protein